MLEFDNYVPKETGVKAVLLTGANLQEAAKLCGGEVGTRTSPTGIDSAHDTVLRIPTLYGPEEVTTGDYLVKDENGRFSGWNRNAFEAKYKKIGLRQDGWQRPPATRGGLITKGPPPFVGDIMNDEESEGEYKTRMGWGLNSDCP